MVVADARGWGWAELLVPLPPNVPQLVPATLCEALNVPENDVGPGRYLG